MRFTKRFLATLMTLSLSSVPAWADRPAPDHVAADEVHLSQVERLLGSAHPHIALLLARLGASYAPLDPRQAEEHYRRAIAILSEAEANNHPQFNSAGLVAVRKMYAAFLRSQDRTWEAVTEESRAAADQQELDWQLKSSRDPALLDLDRDRQKAARRAQ